jgi:hypothetical protein
MKVTRESPLHNAEGGNVQGPRRQAEKPALSSQQKSELLEYFQQRESNLKVARTTVTPSGQILDWINIDSQIPKGPVATPPAAMTELHLDKDPKKVDKLGTFELETDIERGPKGTVPVLRKDTSKLRFDKSLHEFLSKHGNSTIELILNGRHAIAQPEIGSPHDYAFTGQQVTCYGGEGYLSAYDPYTMEADEFSLMQIGLARGGGNGRQTVEGGWQEYRDLYGDWVPHLFVYYTTNGYSKDGNNIGGYNRDVDGWVQYSDLIYPGAVSSPNSSPGGDQYVMFIKYQLFEGNWWFNCNGHWIGYYPASLFNDAGLRSQADSLAFFGEIVDSAAHSGATRTDMGSGYWAEYEWPYAAYQRNLLYQSDTNGNMSTYVADTAWATDVKEYDITSHMNSGTSWGSYFWLGGPGAG